MNEYILGFHAFVGIISVASAVTPLAKSSLVNNKYVDTAFYYSTVAVFASGAGLLLSGASFTRTCISAGALLAVVIVSRKFSVYKANLHTNK